MSNEEIVKEIDEATRLMAEARVKTNEALCHARNVVMNSKGNEEAYNKGLNDVWKLARKIFTFNNNKMEEIFGVAGKRSAFDDLSPQVALAKFEIYEKEQNEIKVGDVVESTTTGKEFLIITEENDDSAYEFGVIDLERMIIDRICNDTRYFKKTGKHIDIQSVLQQIGGVE